MLPDRVSNPGPLTYESGALPIALRGPALSLIDLYQYCIKFHMSPFHTFKRYALYKLIAKIKKGGNSVL